MQFDHFAVSANTLAEATSHVEQALGVSLQAGGRHTHFGTHNTLLGLGPFYLEAIAIDPDAAPLGYPRWFSLDEFTGGPRITNWICQSTTFDATRNAFDLDLGAPVALQRDDLRWTMAVPADGRLPFDGACPALIDWGTTAHPATRLEDKGCRLDRLVIAHPEAAALTKALADFDFGDLIVIEQADALAFMAKVSTPHGQRTLT